MILVGLYLARPLWQASQEEQGRLSRRQLLVAEKEGILNQIRDIDFDHDTGKMPDAIHQSQRAQLMNRAAEILQQLEPTAAITPPPETSSEEDVDAVIEAAVMKMRQGKPKGRPAPAASVNGRFCPNCGQSVDAGDKFCVSCGQKLRARKAVS